MDSSTSSSEAALFAEGNTLVSATRVVIGATTYPLANVSSVALRASAPRGRYFVALLVGIAALIALSTQAWIVCAILTVALITLVATARSQYSLVIGTSGGDRTALRGGKLADVRRVESAINTAIISRG